MEPLSRRGFRILLAPCIILAVACACFALVDERSMDFTNADVDALAPSIGDRAGYRVDDSGEVYRLELAVTSVTGLEVECDIVVFSGDGAYSGMHKGVRLPSGMMSGDGSDLGRPLALKKTRAEVHETGGYRLTCTMLRFEGDASGFDDILVRLGIGDRSAPSSGTAELKVFMYSGMLVDYELDVFDGGSARTLRLSLDDAVPAAFRCAGLSSTPSYGRPWQRIR